MTIQKPCEKCGKLVLEAGCVSVPAAEYSELLKAGSRDQSHAGKQPEYWLRSRSPIAKNPALIAYLLEAIKTKTYLEIIADTRGKFGLHEDLSKSSLSRFLRAIKLGKISVRER